MLGRLTELEYKHFMMHLGQGNPIHEYTLGDERPESSPAEKDSEVLVDEKLSVSWQCVLAAWKAWKAKAKSK